MPQFSQQQIDLIASKVLVHLQRPSEPKKEINLRI